MSVSCYVACPDIYAAVSCSCGIVCKIAMCCKCCGVVFAVSLLLAEFKTAAET